MKYYIVILMLFILFVPLKTDLSAGSIDTTNLIAYPNPFNPLRDNTVTIGYQADPYGAGSEELEVKIFNINGDLVKTKNASGFTTTWNGRNNRGSVVYPGLYILRIKIDFDNGDSAVKILRLLVNH